MDVQSVCCFIFFFKQKTAYEIFTGSIGSIERGDVLIMPVDMAKAIVSEAHRGGKPVFAHPSNGEGIEVAIQSGVDVLAHPATEGNPYTPSLTLRMKAAHLALIPRSLYLAS